MEKLYSAAEMRDELLKKEAEYFDSGLSIFEADEKLISFLLCNTDFYFDAANIFFVKIACEWSMMRVEWQRYGRVKPKEQLCKAKEKLIYTGDRDFGHTAPDFEAVLSLGIAGIIERAGNMPEDTEEKKAYKSEVLSCWSAARKLILKIAEKAESIGRKEMATGLYKLLSQKPETLYEAMQSILIYYQLQQCEQTICRTLGRLDRLLESFYRQDIASGRLTENEAEKLCDAFVNAMESYHVGSNLPFAVAGSKDGRPYHSKMTWLLLRSFGRIKPVDTKMHFLYADGLPEDLVKEAFSNIRNGANSIVFMNDAAIISSLIKIGDAPADAENYSVVGCYESGAYGEVTCSCNARVNLARTVEFALNNGKALDGDEVLGLPCETPETFDEFKKEVARQICFAAKNAMELTHLDEKCYPVTHTAPFFSSTFGSVTEKGQDIYHSNAARYNNSSLNGIGVATATDALCAVKKLVYDDKELTVPELLEILKNNWAGYEPLRQRVLNRFPKYGNGDGDADSLAAFTVHTLASCVNGKPNARGGVWRTGIFSIDWRLAFGEKTPASADGRLSGSPLSKNSSASLGGDREGVLGLISSAVKISPDDIPNGGVLDVVMSHTATGGENGMIVLLTTLKQFMDNGGFAVHYNVLDAEKLRKAKEDPSLYPNLQVRLCGWNARFNDLDIKEKEYFIRRAEAGE